MLTSNLIGAGAQLPTSVDSASILMSDHGLRYLQSICHNFDITEIGNLSPPSQWIFACLVGTVSSCYESVSRQLQGFPVNASQFYISAERLTNKINRPHESLRRRFLLSLSVGLLSYIAALSTCSADDPPFYSLGEGDGSARRLGTVCALGRRV